MAGLYITIGILVAVLLLVIYSVLAPKLGKYRVSIKRIEPKKRRTAKPTKKKKKSVWIKVL